MLILLASVLLFGTAADVWVKRQVLSTPKWVAASDKILADPKVQAALSTYIVDRTNSLKVGRASPDHWPLEFVRRLQPLSRGFCPPTRW